MTRKSIERELRSSFTKTIKGDQIIETANHLQKSPDSSVDIEMDQDILMVDHGSEKMNDSGQANGRENDDLSATTRQRSSDTLSDRAENGLEILTKGVKELVQAIQRLRDLGIENFIPPLPKIVVVGDQSTGKSSLIEGMSGIKVPRDIGTCTRCPLEINLSESASINDVWSCKVSIIKKYIYTGKDKAATKSGRQSFIKSEGATHARPLGPWTSQDSEPLPFATLTSKDEVAQTLKLAQLAILNPSASHEDYMPGKIIPGEERQVQFSPNVVRLEISGPDLPNLSFYDLPGVINVSEVAEEEYLVKLVRNLVMEYIKQETCINILAIPMTDDPANSTAFDIIRRFKAEARTIGVLTKPDRIQSEESRDQWIDILEGQKFKLGLGYFIVKNNPDTRVDHATARLEESVFFSQQPWSTELNGYQSQFGTVNLQTSLSHRLTTAIKASLPRIISQVQEKAADIDAELGTIPELPTGNLSALVIAKITRFEKEIESEIDGGLESHPFRKKWKRVAKNFEKLLEMCRPSFQFADPQMANLNTEEPISTPTPAKRKNPSGPITIDDDDDGLDLPVRKRHQHGVGMDISPYRRLPTGSIVNQKTPQTPQSQSRKDNSSGKPANQFTLEEVRSIKDDYVGLPDGVNPKSREKMIRKSLKCWDTPLNQFLDSTEKLCQEMITETIANIFGCWESTQLYIRVKAICYSFLGEVLIYQRQAVKRTQSLEFEIITAYNSRLLNSYCNQARTELGDNRRKQRADDFVERQESRTSKFSTGPARDEKVAKITDQQLGPDPFSLEVELMASARGYYDYAVSRFVDGITQGIQGELFLKCRNDIGKRLTEEIGTDKSDANEQCAILLDVDTANRERRIVLKKEKSTIDEAQRWLEGLTKEAAEEYL